MLSRQAGKARKTDQAARGPLVHMPNYIHELIKLAAISQKEVTTEESDAHVLEQEALVDASFAFPNQPLKDKALHQALSAELAQQPPALESPSWLPSRDLSKPSAVIDSRQDPLVHWHQQGRPSGPGWCPDPARTHPENTASAQHGCTAHPRFLSRASRSNPAAVALQPRATGSMHQFRRC